MGEYSILLGIAVFIGFIAYIGSIGGYTGMQTDALNTTSNFTVNESGAFSNLQTMNNYLTSMNSDYPMLKYMVVIPIGFLTLYFVLKIIIDLVPL